MPSFYVDPKDFTENRAVLKGAEARHVRNVFRLGPGESIVLFDGRGHQYKGEIMSAGSVVTIQLLEKETIPPERFEITLAQACLKSDKMELIFQKATELGVSKILPFFSSRTVPKDPGAKLERWQKIILAAAKQSGRATLPEIMSPCPMPELLTQFDKTTVRLLLSERRTKRHLKEILRESAAGTSLRNIIPFRIEKIVGLIGPEGGFSDEEMDLAEEAGFIPVSLGRRILRAETAAITFLSVLQYEMGTL